MTQAGFFDMRSRLANPKAAATAAAGGPTGVEPITPSQLSRMIDAALKVSLPQTLLVRGEVSNFSRNRASGHLYFSLKDAQGCVDAVMWASRAERLRFEPKDGMELIATGSVGVYIPRGRYQITVNALDPVGEGALELAKRQLEERLRAAGLFDDEGKRPIPRYSRAVALVTSPQAAGFADMLKVLRRCSWLRLMIYPVPVQGAAAAPAIAAALTNLARGRADGLPIDVVLLGRGGGSLEDLWAFNEEAVARAMHNCPIPIITGIGHETDVSIADLVADYHAHTPTEAATYVTRAWSRADETLGAVGLRLLRETRRVVADARSQVSSIARHELFRRPGAIFDLARQRLDDQSDRLSRALNDRLREARSRLDRSAAALAQHPPGRRLGRARDTIDARADALGGSIRRQVSQRRSTLDGLDARLRALSPLNVLQRGYSITTLKRDGTLVRDGANVRGGEVLVTRLADGTVESVAKDGKQPELF